MRRLLPLLLLLSLAPPAAARDLAAAFDHVVFGPGPLRESLIRVEAPAIRYVVYGDLDDGRLAILQRHAGDLAAITGKAVSVERGADPAPPVTIGDERVTVLQLHIVPRAGFAALLAQHWIPAATQRSHSQALCSFVTMGRATVRAGLILIDAADDEATVRHCLIEETTQALGPFDDTAELDPSAYNDFGELIDRLQLDDVAILKALYDPRLAAGMDRAAVLALLPAILSGP